MKGKTNTIIINGRVYNAVTGLPVDGHVVSPSSITTSRASAPTASSHVVKSKSTPTTHKPAHKIIVNDTSSPVATAVQKRSSTSRQPQAAKRHPERAQTLMRHLVKKPSRSTSVRHAVSTPLDSQQKNHGTKIIVHKASAKAITLKASSVKSSQISRFTPSTNVTKRTAHLPVATAPHHVKKQTSHKLVATHASAAPAAAPHSAHYNIAHTPPAPVVIPDNQPLRALHRDLFETAMQASHSHEAPKHKKTHSKHRRAARFTLAASSLMLLIAFFAYQNAPNLALKRASSTIGFTASLPTYRPSGFRMAGGVQYQPGKVVVSFRSNSDTRAYNVTQVTSSITDDTLRQRFLKGQNYEQINANGQTAYMYGSDNLTWIRNGIWYTIDGDSDLSKDQLVRVASSLL